MLEAGLMGYPSRTLEDNGVESYMGCGGPAQEVSEGNSISTWARSHCRDTLAKTVTDFSFVLRIKMRPN